jgi:hypothetical protein
MKKMGNKLNRTFSKEEVQMAKKHKKICSLSLAIKKMQIKTTRRFHLLMVEWLPLRAEATTNAAEDVGKMELSYTVGGNVSQYNHYG